MTGYRFGFELDTNPFYIHTSNTDITALFGASENSSTIRLYSGDQSNQGFNITTDVSPNLNIYRNNYNDSLFFIDGNTGCVGIGTTKPSNKLDIQGDLYIEGQLIQRGSNSILVTEVVVAGTSLYVEEVRSCNIDGTIKFVNSSLAAINDINCITLHTCNIDVHGKLTTYGNSTCNTQQLIVHNCEENSISPALKVIQCNSNEPVAQFYSGSNVVFSIGAYGIFGGTAIGIGTTTPNANLHIVNEMTTTAKPRIQYIGNIQTIETTSGDIKVNNPGVYQFGHIISWTGNNLDETMKMHASGILNLRGSNINSQYRFDALIHTLNDNISKPSLDNNVGNFSSYIDTSMISPPTLRIDRYSNKSVYLYLEWNTIESDYSVNMDLNIFATRNTGSIRVHPLLMYVEDYIPLLESSCDIGPQIADTGGLVIGVSSRGAEGYDYANMNSASFLWWNPVWIGLVNECQQNATCTSLPNIPQSVISPYTNQNVPFVEYLSTTLTYSDPYLADTLQISGQPFLQYILGNLVRFEMCHGQVPVIVSGTIQYGFIFRWDPTSVATNDMISLHTKIYISSHDDIHSYYEYNAIVSLENNGTTLPNKIMHNEINSYNSKEITILPIVKSKRISSSSVFIYVEWKTCNVNYMVNMKMEVIAPRSINNLGAHPFINLYRPSSTDVILYQNTNYEYSTIPGPLLGKAGTTLVDGYIVNINNGLRKIIYGGGYNFNSLGEHKAGFDITWENVATNLRQIFEVDFILYGNTSTNNFYKKVAVSINPYNNNTTLPGLTNIHYDQSLYCIDNNTKPIIEVLRLNSNSIRLYCKWTNVNANQKVFVKLEIVSSNNLGNISIIKLEI